MSYPNTLDRCVRLVMLQLHSCFTWALSQLDIRIIRYVIHPAWWIMRSFPLCHWSLFNHYFTLINDQLSPVKCLNSIVVLYGRLVTFASLLLSWRSRWCLNHCRPIQAIFHLTESRGTIPSRVLRHIYVPSHLLVLVYHLDPNSR